ncbi:MAG: hypothetical protein AAB319_06060 [Pseudomonadota bacterium]
MPTHLTATNLRASLFRTLDQVLSSGVAVEVERPGGTVRIVPGAPSGRLARLYSHPGTIVGDAQNLPEVSWEGDWRPHV